MTKVTQPHQDPRSASSAGKRKQKHLLLHYYLENKRQTTHQPDKLRAKQFLEEFITSYVQEEKQIHQVP